ncbi:MAG: glycosyltransferase family 2 protein [Bdellovibrionia bacterium]
MKPQLSLIIPCYNEHESIDGVMAKVIQFQQSEEAIKHFSGVEVIVVDDNSNDGSSRLLQKYQSIKVITHPKNQGYGGALKTGFKSAKGDLLSFLDMDSSYEPFDLIPLYQKLTLSNAEIIFGNRMDSQEGMNFIRGFGNDLYRHMVKLMFGSKLSDVCTGIRLFKRSLRDSILELPTQGLNYSLEFTVWVLQNKVPYEEVTVNYYPRTGESKLSEWSDGWAFLKVILVYRLRNLWWIKS